MSAKMSKEDSDALEELSEATRDAIRRHPGMIKSVVGAGKARGILRSNITAKEYLVDHGFDEAEADELLRKAGL